MTPLQILLQHEKELTQMFDSDTKVALVLLDTIRKTGKQLLEDEKKITRLEIINHAKNDRQIGRLLSLHKSLGDFNAIEVQLQDGGTTMKIFLD